MKTGYNLELLGQKDPFVPKCVKKVVVAVVKFSELFPKRYI